jgi:hypothetical protein
MQDREGSEKRDDGLCLQAFSRVRNSVLEATFWYILRLPP